MNLNCKLISAALVVALGCGATACAQTAPKGLPAPSPARPCPYHTGLTLHNVSKDGPPALTATVTVPAGCEYAYVAITGGAGGTGKLSMQDPTAMDPAGLSVELHVHPGDVIVLYAGRSGTPWASQCDPHGPMGPMAGGGGYPSYVTRNAAVVAVAGGAGGVGCQTLAWSGDSFAGNTLPGVMSDKPVLTPGATASPNAPMGATGPSYCDPHAAVNCPVLFSHTWDPIGETSYASVRWMPGPPSGG